MSKPSLRPSSAIRNVEAYGVQRGSAPIDLRLDGNEGLRPDAALLELSTPSRPGLCGQATSQLQLSIDGLTDARISQHSPPCAADTLPALQGRLWIDPVTGTLAPSELYNGFGPRRFTSGSYSFHPGQDIRSERHTPILATGPGQVIHAGRHSNYSDSGRFVILDHGQGLSSSFLHLSKILLESGTEVKKGELIAEVGATGRASGPHLDWRMNWLNRRVDPELLLEGSPAAADETH